MQAYLAYLFMQAMLNLWERFIGFVFFLDLLCKHAFCATISFLLRKDIWEITHNFGMHIKRKRVNITRSGHIRQQQFLVIYHLLQGVLVFKIELYSCSIHRWPEVHT